MDIRYSERKQYACIVRARIFGRISLGNIPKTSLCHRCPAVGAGGPRERNGSKSFEHRKKKNVKKTSARGPYCRHYCIVCAPAVGPSHTLAMHSIQRPRYVPLYFWHKDTCCTTFNESRNRDWGKKKIKIIYAYVTNVTDYTHTYRSAYMHGYYPGAPDTCPTHGCTSQQ